VGIDSTRCNGRSSELIRGGDCPFRGHFRRGLGATVRCAYTTHLEPPSSSLRRVSFLLQAWSPSLKCSCRLAATNWFSVVRTLRTGFTPIVYYSPLYTTDRQRRMPGEMFVSTRVGSIVGTRMSACDASHCTTKRYLTDLYVFGKITYMLTIP
jgi:hypothetical protein